MSSFTIHAVPATEARRIFRILLAAPDQSSADLERQVSALLEYARALTLDLNRLWQAYEGGRAVGTLACIESPGRTAMLFLRDGRLAETAPPVLDALLRHAVEQESQRDIRLLQCLTLVSDRANQAALARGGFSEIATLVYMDRPIDPAPPLPPAVLPADDLQWSTYEPGRRAVFADLISATYRDSLDCPRLTGLRAIEDILDGHQSVGYFDPRHWLLLHRGAHPAACILLAENPLRPALELTYMGVHPDERRRGLSRLLVSQALYLAQREGIEAITVAVDEANEPARRVYASCGFRETARRRAFVRPAGPSSTGP